MRKFLWRDRIGDHALLAIGLLVGAAVAALLGFAVLVAKRVDADSLQRELELGRSGLVMLKVKIRHDLSSFAYWDDAVDYTTRAADKHWIHRNFGARLYTTGGYDRAFILGSSGDAIYASVNGSLVLENFYERLRDTVEPFVAQVRAAYAKEVTANAYLREIGEMEPPPEPKFVAAFRRIEGRPALLGVITIVPGIQRASSTIEKPSVAVAVAFLDAALMSEFGASLAISEVSLHQKGERMAGIPEDNVFLDIPLGHDDEPASLIWKPRRPGDAMLTRLMPGLIAIAGLIGIVTLLVLILIRRTTERLSQSERRAKELAFRDTLTGLANRVQLLELLGGWLAEARADRRLALFLIDIDSFKDINDTLGHPVGDEVLFAIGERLSNLAGESGVAVRYGADEFAILLPVGDGNKDIDSMVRRAGEVLRTPVLAGGQQLTVSASIGIAVAPEDAHETDQFIRRADIALYRAKADGRGSCRQFELSFEESLQKRSQIERELSHAIGAEQLAVKFQPQYAADGERIVGLEALVRWNHPERGVIPPSEFIPVAEQTGLIARIDAWVLRRACEHAMQWPGVSLAVNLSPSNFRQPNVAERLNRVLVDTGLDPRRLEIEITESMLLGANSDILGELSEMRRLGIRIALDDFGTGYSSLGYLRSFPVDKIKIDKSFVQNLGITEDAAAIVECVARLGRALGLAVTAEGVETGEQHRFVRAVGCHQVQGYLFSPPVDPTKIDEMMRRGSMPVAVQKPKLLTA